MELNKNSWHSKLYTYMYNKSTPNDGCDYFRGLLFAILLFPLLFPFGYLFKKISAPLVTAIGLNLVFDLFIFMISYEIIIDDDYSTLIILLSALACVACVVGILFLAFYIGERRERNRYRYKEPSKLSKEITEIKSIISESIKAFKGKYCPKITWK